MDLLDLMCGGRMAGTAVDMYLVRVIVNIRGDVRIDVVTCIVLDRPVCGKLGLSMCVHCGAQLEEPCPHHYGKSISKARERLQSWWP